VNHFVHCAKLAEGFGVPQVMMCKPRVVAHSMAALATTYALGSWMRVPWDCYMDNDPKTRLPAPRYFGKLEDWGPFYDFVHDHPQLFDGYQSAATVGVLINGDEDTFTPFWDLTERLLKAQVQFRVIAAASQLNRLPLRPEALAAFRHVVALSKPESFTEENRRVLEQAKASMRVRFISPEEDVPAVLASAGRQLLKLEAPDNVYAFLRVKPDAAVVHLVNWNADASGERSAVFKHVTVQLLHPKRWGGKVKATYYQPGQEAGVELTPEIHPGMIRLTVPQFATWGVVEILQDD